MKKRKGIIFGSSSISITLFRLPLIEEIIKKGHTVEVWGPADQDSKRVITKLKKLGINYRIININNTSLNFTKDIKHIIQIIRLFKKIRPDFLICHTIKPIIYGSLCGSLLKVKKIYSLVTGLGYVFIESKPTHIIIKFFVKVLYKASFIFNDRVFFQNTDDRKIFDFQLKKNSFEIIPGSGVDTSYYSYSPPKTLETPITFLFIGRLIKHKGIIEFVEAAKIIKKKHKETSFVVIGRFDDNPSSISKEMLDYWGREGYIFYEGYHEDVRPFIKRSSVFVLPSYREGMPRSVLEAMATGRPIITTDVAGCRDTVINGLNGFLVEKKSSKSLAKAMEKFLKDPTLIPKMGAESRKIAETKYNLDKINEAFMKGMEF